MKLILLGVMIVIALSSCSTIDKTFGFFQDPTSRTLTPKTPELYTKATRELEKNDFQAALDDYHAFLEAEPTTAYTMVANYNSGRAYMGLRKFPEAIDKFHFVSNQTTGHAPTLQALAFYQLSFCYEGMGDSAEVIASLLDTARRQQYLPREVAQAELPARLAGAYAAIGNIPQASEYYTKAEAGIKQLKREIQGGPAPEWLGKALYYMGEVSLRKISFSEIEAVLRPLSRAQLYLLESAELDTPVWSEKAKEALAKTYAQTLQAIESSSETQKTLSIELRRAEQERQWQHAQEFVNVVDELKTYKSPDEKGQNKILIEIFKMADETRAALLAILAQPKIGIGLTEEAEERKKSVRGKVVAPTSELENDYARTKKKNRKLPAKEEKVQQPVPAPQDPNL